MRSPTTAILLAATMAVAACGSDAATATAAAPVEGSSATTATTNVTPTSATTSTAPAADPLVDVERAFHAQWDAFVDVLGAPDISDPLIDAHFTGRAREHLVDVVSEFLAEGKVAVRPDDPADFSPRVVAIALESPTSALVHECTRDGVVILDARSGAVLDGDVSTFEARNTFHLVDGRWKLANTDADLDDGEPSCDDR